MHLATRFSSSIAFLLLVAAGCGAEMTDEQDDATAGSTAGVGGAYTGAAGSSGYGGTGGAGVSGSGGLGGASGNAGSSGTGGTSGTGGEAGTAGWRPGTGGDAGWPGTAGDAAGSGGWPGTGGDAGWQGGGDTIALEDTPAAVQETIAGLLGSNPVEDIQLNDQDGDISYEVDATVDGSRIEYIIAEDGTLLRTQQEIEPGELPEAVMSAVTGEIGDGEIRRVEMVDEEGVTTYEIRATSADGDRVRLTVAEDGTLLESGDTRP